ncbi:MAG: hypothetical protein A3K60_00010 [Euryarchaeota archaeon RBG_19FT_COMBO_56_21]|nr:MAG: hypothetical protein A3K60_00010 [Euryarchaeota archaeon RBG_19FT_COMBO_56_21]
MDRGRSKTGFCDYGKGNETITLGVLIEYKYLKYNDIQWAYNFVRKATNEVIHRDNEVRKILNKPEDIKILVQAAGTGNSLHLEFVFAAAESLRGMDIDTLYRILSIGYLVKKLFDYLSKESEDGRYICRRSNVDRIVVSTHTQRFGPGGSLTEDVREIIEAESGTEEFELRIRR